MTTHRRGRPQLDRQGLGRRGDADAGAHARADWLGARRLACCAALFSSAALRCALLHAALWHSSPAERRLPHIHATQTKRQQVKSPMTLTEKILASRSGGSVVRPGDNIWTKVDKLMTHDVCGPGTFGIFQKEFGEGAQVRSTADCIGWPLCLRRRCCWVAGGSDRRRLLSQAAVLRVRRDAQTTNTNNPQSIHNRPHHTNKTIRSGTTSASCSSPTTTSSRPTRARTATSTSCARWRRSTTSSTSTTSRTGESYMYIYVYIVVMVGGGDGTVLNW